MYECVYGMTDCRLWSRVVETDRHYVNIGQLWQQQRLYGTLNSQSATVHGCRPHGVTPLVLSSDVRLGVVEHKKRTAQVLTQHFFQIYILFHCERNSYRVYFCVAKVGVETIVYWNQNSILFLSLQCHNLSVAQWCDITTCIDTYRHPLHNFPPRQLNLDQSLAPSKNMVHMPRQKLDFAS